MAPIGSIDLGAIMHVGLFAETVAISGEMLLRYLPQRRPTYFRNRQLTAQTHFSHHRTFRGKVKTGDDSVDFIYDRRSCFHLLL